MDNQPVVTRNGFSTDLYLDHLPDGQDEVLRHVPVVVISVMVPDGESRRLGNTLGVYAPEGFTNEEALTYLPGIVESAAALAP